MIKNSKQLKNTEKKINKLLEFINKSGSIASEKDDTFNRVEIEATKSMVDSLQREIYEFKCVKNDSTISFENIEVADLSKLVIYARIAEGISQEELANRIGVKQQQINRYESNDYETASLSRILDVIDALKIDLNLSAKITKPAVKNVKKVESIGNVSNERITEFQKKIVLERRLLRA